MKAPPKPTIEELVDKYGALQAAIAPLKVKEAQAKELAAKICEYADQKKFPIDESKVVNGTKYMVLLGPKAKVRKITNMAKLYKLLGMKAFLERCGFALGDLDELVPKAQHEGMVSEERTGKRSVTPAPLAATTTA